MKIPNHDLKDGFQDKCQICGSKNLHEIIDLGNQPLADKLPLINENATKVISYPLIQSFCKDCGLNQLRYICSSKLMFGDNYNYKTGVTKELVDYQANMASTLVEELCLSQKDLVCDLGSNDGTLLKGFKNCGVKIFGVEPTDISEIANNSGIPTLRSPFGVKAAEIIKSKYGEASLATATNVFAHVQNLGDFLRGLNILLKENAYFCFENHYLNSILENTQYDTIYHEHLRSLSLTAIKKLFSFYNFTLIKVKETSRYGGNIRILVRKGKNHEQERSITDFLEKEKKLFNLNIYKKFKDNAIKSKIELLKTLIDLKSRGKYVVGYSLPARAMTLINYVGIDNDMIPYIVEQPNSLKLNKYVPGTRIPILSNTCLEREKPEYLLVFAWHLKKEIISYLRRRGIKCKCIFPLPEVEILEL